MGTLESLLPQNPELPQVREAVSEVLERLLESLPPIPISTSLLSVSGGQQREEYAALAEALGRQLCAYFEHFCAVRNYCSVAYVVFSELHCSQCISADYLRQVFWSYQRGSVTDIDAISYCAIVAAGSSLSSFDGLSDDAGSEALGGADGPAPGSRDSIFDPLNKYARQRRRMESSLLPAIDVFKTELSSSGLPLMSECYGVLLAAELLSRAGSLSVDPENELEYESIANRSMHLASGMFNNAWARVSAMGLDLREIWAVPAGRSANAHVTSAAASQVASRATNQVTNQVSTATSELPHTPKLDKAMCFSVFSAEGHRSTPVFNQTLTSMNVVNPTTQIDIVPQSEAVPPRLRDASRLGATARDAEEALAALSNSSHFTTSTRSLEPANLFPESSVAEREEGRRVAAMSITASLARGSRAEGTPGATSSQGATGSGLLRYIHLMGDRVVLLILTDVASRLFCRVREYCVRVRERYDHEVRISREAARAQARREALLQQRAQAPYGASTVSSRAAAARGAALRAGQSTQQEIALKDLLTTAPEGKTVKPPSVRIRDPSTAQAQRALKMKALPLRDYVDNVVDTYMTAVYSNLASWSSIRHLVFSLAYSRAVLCSALYDVHTLPDAVYLLSTEASVRKAFSDTFIGQANNALFEFVVWMGSASVRKTTFDGATPATMNDAILSSRVAVEDTERSRMFLPGQTRKASGRPRSGGTMAGTTSGGLLRTALPAQPNPMTEVDNLIIQLRVWALHLGSKLIYGGLDIGAVPYIHDPAELIAFAHFNSLWGRFEPNEAASLLVVLWAFNTSLFPAPEEAEEPEEPEGAEGAENADEAENVEEARSTLALTRRVRSPPVAVSRSSTNVARTSGISADSAKPRQRGAEAGPPRSSVASDDKLDELPDQPGVSQSLDGCNPGTEASKRTHKRAIVFCEVGSSLVPMVRRASQHLQIALDTMVKDLYLYFSQPPGSAEKCEIIYRLGS